MSERTERALLAAILGLFVLLGAIYMGFTLAIYGMVALLSGGMGERLLQHPALADRFRWLAGTAFIMLGLWALVEQH